MPWIIEDTSKPKDNNFLRKLPGAGVKFGHYRDATVYRTKDLAIKQAKKHEEFFDIKTNEIISFDEWWNSSEEKVDVRPATTLVLHEIDFDFIKSEKFTLEESKEQLNKNHTKRFKNVIKKAIDE